MRLHGYCERCHKIKLVTVHGGLTTRSVPYGICAQCEEERNAPPRTR